MSLCKVDFRMIEEVSQYSGIVKSMKVVKDWSLEIIFRNHTEREGEGTSSQRSLPRGCGLFTYRWISPHSFPIFLPPGS